MEKEIVRKIYEYMQKMKNPQGDILELLLVAQKEARGIIPPWLQEELSEILGIELLEIKETIEFFDFLKEKEELPKLSICMGSSCYMAGNSLNEGLLREKEGKLYEIQYKECEEACEYGPRISLGDKTFHFVDENEVEEIIKYLEEEKHEKERGFL